MPPCLATFDNSYARLPPRFFALTDPTPVAAPRLIACNRALAQELGLDLAGLDDTALAALFSGNQPPPGAARLAMAYAGHQFGNFVPQLGDGRALLLGEVIDARGRRRDLQWKGAGPTPFSRRGDGRAALGPVLREYLVSEAMHALGVPTTRALAAVTTGETVMREGMPPGAVVTRVAASHIRVGTFEYFAARGDLEGVRLLADHVLERHYPALAPGDYLGLLEGVIERQCQLIAHWVRLGFIHGVMNTDNMTVSGETIDYGPCAFMEAYDPSTVFSAIDRGGRYAYAQQPRIAQWNLARLAETLLPLIDADEAKAVETATALLNTVPARFEAHRLADFRAKLGLATAEPGDARLVEALLEAMHRGTADFTLTFRRLCDAAADAPAGEAVRTLFREPADFDAWAVQWRERLSREGGAGAARAAAMRLVNPAYTPRNHRVEQAIRAAEDHGDFAPFHRLLAVVTDPFTDRAADAAYAAPAAPEEVVRRTFCGT